MKGSQRRISSLIIFMLGSCLLIFTTACSSPTTCKTNTDCAGGQVCKASKCETSADGGTVKDGGTKDGGMKDDVKKDEGTKDEGTKDSGKNPGKDDSKDPDKKDPDKKIDPNDECAPGCQTCIKLGIGSSCKDPKANPKTLACPSGSECLENGDESAGYCYQNCTSNSDCQTKGQTCISGPKDQTTSSCSQRGPNDPSCICGKKNGQDEVCNYTQQLFCKKGHTCLVINTTENAGTCVKTCADGQDCALGMICKGKKCSAPVCSGPKTYKDVCSTELTSNNCAKGLTCTEGQCFKKCKTTDDCQKSKGEKCALIAIGQPRVCQPAPLVKKSGEKCDGFNRCDPSLSLLCIKFTGGSFCVKRCKEKQKGDCKADQTCGKIPGLDFPICQDHAKENKRCDSGQLCTDKLSICVRLSTTVAYCLKLCKRKDSKSDVENNHPGCSSGKGQCSGLQSEQTIDGKKYDGICFNRKQTVKIGGECATTPTGATCEIVKNGPELSCLNLGGGAKCMKKCDPCKSTKTNDGDWKNPACSECTALSYSDGRYAFSVCRLASSGPPKKDPSLKYVLKPGDYCDQDGKACITTARCISFTGADHPVCLSICDPASDGNKFCVSKGFERCAALTDGSGVCIVRPKSTKKRGQSCGGGLGTDSFNLCVKTDKGKTLQCSRKLDSATPRYCRVACKTTKGLRDNSDCKAAGLKNHICLPSDLRAPAKGACHEYCSFIQRAKCSCESGTCERIPLGKPGACKETQCKKQGGICMEGTCTVTICN